MAKRRASYKTIFRKYLSEEVRLETYQKIGIVFLIVVIAGFIGWVWEFGLSEVSGGFKYFYIKGGNFLPWINLYAYGALLIIVLTYKIRQYPWAVFLVSALATGVLELISGWLVYVFGDGTRYWDYTKSWWGVGNIDGFVCPASVIAFGLGALLLMYILLPFCIYVAKRISKRAFLVLTIILFTVVMVDELTNLTLKNLGLPTAIDFYRMLGFRYK